MAYNYYYRYFSFKKVSDYFPLTWDENQRELYGTINLLHTPFQQYCQFKTDVLSLSLEWPNETTESYYEQSQIRIIENGDSSETTVHCRYNENSWGELQLNCDAAHVAPLEHNQTVIINIQVDE